MGKNYNRIKVVFADKDRTNRWLIEHFFIRNLADDR